MKKLILILLIHVAISSIFAQQLIEEVTKTDNFYDIPFRKYKLDNGLTIILHQDTTVSNVYVNMLYKVGSANEIDGKRGYAHFFEHLMFAGTKTLSKNELWDLFPKTKSSIMNASTTHEFTMYEEEVPVNYLERALWLESQRLLFTPELMNENNVAVQKQVILNEMAMRTEDNMYGVIEKHQKEILYDKQYPYHHPVIGYKEDIEKATLNDIRDFFIKWYVPNNAILSISGNFDYTITLELINKYFATIPIQTLPDVHIDNLSNLQSSVTKDFQYDINFPVYTMTFPTVKRWSLEEAPLDALSYLLSQRDNPLRFADNFKSNIYERAIFISINHPCNKYSGEFEIIFRTNEVVNKPEMLFLNAIATLKKKSFLEENLVEYKEYFKNLTYNRFETTRDIALQLTAYELLLNTPNGLPIEWKRNLALTQDQINSTVNKYLYNKPFIGINLLPYSDKQKNKGRKKLSNQPPSVTDDLWNLAENDNLISKHEINNDIPSEMASEFSPFNFWQEKLSNNIQILGTTGKDKIPVSKLSVTIKAGLLYNKADNAGISQLYVSILNNIIQYNNIRNSLKNIGATVGLNTDDENIIMVLTFPDEQLNRAVVLLDSILFYSEITPASFITNMNFYIKWYNDLFKENPFLTTKAMLRKTLYAPTDLLNYTTFGSKSTIRQITNVYNFVDEINEVLTNNVEICYVGNLPKEKFIEGISGLETWKTNMNKKVQKIPISIQPPEINILFHDKIDANQSNIDIGIKTINNRSTKNQTILELVNYILGETFTSRLNTKLREEKGLAYFCASELPNNSYDDILHIRTNINIEKTDSAVQILIRELNNFIANGVSDNELEKAKKSLLYRINELPEASYQKLNYLQDILAKGNPIVYNTQQIQIIKAMDIAHVNQFIKDYFKPNTYQIAIVSDKIKVLQQLKNLNYKIIDYTDKLF